MGIGFNSQAVSVTGSVVLAMTVTVNGKRRIVLCAGGVITQERRDAERVQCVHDRQRDGVEQQLPFNGKRGREHCDTTVLARVVR